MAQDERDKKTIAPTPGPERAKLNRELAQMLKGGVIMDVTTPEQRSAFPAGGRPGKAMEQREHAGSI